MIDLDKMEQSVNLLMRMYPESTRATQTIGDVHELINRLRQAEKDAARYRWLRDELTQSQGGIALFDSDSYVCDIDLFIDEAMNASNN